MPIGEEGKRRQFATLAEGMMVMDKELGKLQASYHLTVVLCLVACLVSGVCEAGDSMGCSRTIGTHGDQGGREVSGLTGTIISLCHE